MYREADQYARETLQMCKRFGVRTDAAIAYALLGHIAFARREYTEARQHYEQALALFASAGLIWAVGRIHSHLGDVALAVGDYGTAGEYHLQALKCYKDVGICWHQTSLSIGGCYGIPISLQTLGQISLALGNDRVAQQHFHQAVEIAIEQSYTELHLHLLLGPVRLLTREGKVEKAIELAALAQHHPESVEETREKAGKLLDALRAEMAPDLFDAAQKRGRERELDTTMQELLVQLGEQ
jgi:tetratricopeptide (TPR) repeat protein